MVPYDYKYPHELKYLSLMTNFNRCTCTYAPELIVVHWLCGWYTKMLVIWGMVGTRYSMVNCRIVEGL